MVQLEGDISSAYEDVRNDKTDTNWLLLEYQDDKTDVLKLAETGTGGLEEFVSKLKPEQAAFGYLRMIVGNDELSKRAKFVLVSWCGEQVKVMRKAKLSVHIADVKSVIKSFAIEISASHKDELKDKDIRLLLQKAMGANYDSIPKGHTEPYTDGPVNQEGIRERLSFTCYDCALGPVLLDMTQTNLDFSSKVSANFNPHINVVPRSRHRMLTAAKIELMPDIELDCDPALYDQ
ncbi:hypothetical protein HK104_008490 [Borealophlyctis nickersoniae]|nr:hypothetical protein HK104_008490 [Borealophlyctis nickersoniae]